MVAMAKDTPGLKQVLYEDCGGRINIPIELGLPENAAWTNPLKPAALPKFELRPSHLRYIQKYSQVDWISRAYTEQYWQCRACGWKPWPVAVIREKNLAGYDDSVWDWFFVLSAKARRELVIASNNIRRLEREIKTAPRASVYVDNQGRGHVAGDNDHHSPAASDRIEMREIVRR